MNWKCLLLLLSVSSVFAADKMTASQLIEMSRSNEAGLREALVQTLTQDQIQKGTAVLGQGEDFIWAVSAATKPMMMVDDAAGPGMKQIAGSDVWYATGKLPVGTSHTFEYKIDGKMFGGKKDVPAYAPVSYLKPGVTPGKLSEKLVHTSKIYDGMKSDYWIYVPAQYDPKVPAALMVWQDGHFYNKRDNDQNRILDAVDNLIAEHKIPVMIMVFISPGDISGAKDGATYKALEAMIADGPSNPQFPRNPNAPPRTPQSIMRSVLYDTVSDRYAKMLRDEVMPEISAKYNIRKDAYSRGIAGLSSGAICALSVAWFQPDQFSRVLSWIGSYTPLQPEPKWGGQGYPAMVQREAKRNIRIWLQDGAEDQRTWPLQNLEMANSFKAQNYDFHFSYGPGTHNSAQGSAEFPQSFVWLWRDYDPVKTEQQYEIQEAEKAKPPFRVQVYNRDHGAAN